MTGWQWATAILASVLALLLGWLVLEEIETRRTIAFLQRVNEARIEAADEEEPD